MVRSSNVLVSLQINSTNNMSFQIQVHTIIVHARKWHHTLELGVIFLKEPNQLLPGVVNIFFFFLGWGEEETVSFVYQYIYHTQMHTHEQAYIEFVYAKWIRMIITYVWQTSFHEAMYLGLIPYNVLQSHHLSKSWYITVSVLMILKSLRLMRYPSW